MTPADFVIRRAGPALAGDIFELLRECGRDMAAHGFSNWDPPPATAESIRAETEEHVVLAAFAAEDALVGTVTLRREPTHGYDADVRAGRVAWAPPGGGALYLNRLAVHPAQQRAGLGARLLRAAEEAAARAGAAALRFDVLADNPGLVEWYRRRGYLPRGRRRHSGKDFLVLERAI